MFSRECRRLAANEVWRVSQRNLQISIPGSARIGRKPRGKDHWKENYRVKLEDHDEQELGQKALITHPAPYPSHARNRFGSSDDFQHLLRPDKEWSNLASKRYVKEAVSEAIEASKFIPRDVKRGTTKKILSALMNETGFCYRVKDNCHISLLPCPLVEEKQLRLLGMSRQLYFPEKAKAHLPGKFIPFK